MRYHLLTLFLAMTLGFSWAMGATYTCTTGFGETVPVRKIVLKPGKNCDACLKPGASIPSNLIDKAHSREWNPHAEKVSDSSQVKRRLAETKNRRIMLDTRYLHSKGPDFRFELQCAPKCEGRFLETPDPNRIRLDLASGLHDKRPEAKKGYAVISLAKREYFGFIARVFKENIPLKNGEQIPVSSSGELKFFKEDPLYVLDTGADEHLHLFEDAYERLAALEIKITCRIEASGRSSRK